MEYLFFTMVLLSSCYLLFLLLSRYFYNINTIDINFFSKDVMTALKGFAIIIIITAHIANMFGIRYLNPWGAWGVAIFLFCSGYGLEKSVIQKGLNGFWKKRIKKVYLLYFIIEVFASIFIYDNTSGLEILLDLSLVKTHHPFGWYMQCLFMYYLAFYIGHKFRINWMKYFTCIILSLILFIFADVLFKQQIFSFLLGMLVADQCYIERRLEGDTLVLIVSVFMAILLLVLKQLPILRLGNQFIYRFVEALDAIFMLLISLELINSIIKKAPILIIPFIIIGNISYEIYLVHAFLMPTKVSNMNILKYYILTFFVAIIVNQRKCIWKPFRRKNENTTNS